MNPIVPHLDDWTEVVVWVGDFLAMLLGVNSDLCNLFVEFDNHQAQPWGRGVPAVPCHVVDCVHALFNVVDGELLPYYLVVSPH